MLIEIINTEIDLENSLKRIVITNLLNSFRMGYHIIVFENEVLEKIIKSEHFGTNEKSYARELKNRKRLFFHSIKLLLYKVIVDFDNEFSLISSRDYTINVSYKYFIDNNLNPTKLLAEDIIDTKLYKLITNFYISKENNLKGIRILFDEAHGGGNGTKKRFDEFKSKNVLCLCLVDNDKKHPNGKRGTTIAKFHSKDFLLDKTVLAYNIGVHEIENLIPCYIINKIMENANKNEYSSKQIESLDILKKLVYVNPDIKKYFDHKLGITSKNIIEWDTDYGDFWLPIIKDIVKNNCLISRKCTCKFECKVLYGFSDSLLEKSLEFINKESIGSIDKNLPDFLKNIWLEIGKVILGWSCSLEKVRC